MYTGITVSGKYTSLGSDESGEWKGHHIDRSLFDAYLFAAAQKQGVIIFANETVAEITEEKKQITGIRTASGKIITAKYLIDASGHKRVAGKKLRLEEKFYSPAFFVWSGIAEQLSPDFFLTHTQFISSANGWTWLAPEPPDRCTWTRLSLTGDKTFRQPPELDVYGSTKNTFASNRRWRAFRPLVKEGLALCGDAAGIIDPSAGQGILNALMSGIKAGQCVCQCISNAPLQSFYLAQYDDWFIRQFEEKVSQLKKYYAGLGILLFEETPEK
jgi:flavin-dependent dehydrogenase